MTWIKRYKQKKLLKVFSKISVDSNFMFSSSALLCVFHCSHRLPCVELIIVDGTFCKNCSYFILKWVQPNFLWGNVPGGGGGHSHMSVDIKCLSIDPFFYADPTPKDPLFLFSPHPMTPFFHFCIKFYIESANFCALRAHFEKFNNFVAILTENLQILPWNCIFAHWMNPHFWESTKKAPIFVVPTPNDPLFSTKSYTECPYFRSPVGTCMSLSYLSAPPPGGNVLLRGELQKDTKNSNFNNFESTLYSKSEYVPLICTHVYGMMSHS